MVVLNSPIEGCTYATGDIEAAQGAPGTCQQPKTDILSCPKVSNESTSEEWEYFITRWDAYKTVTCIATLQLLECCEDSLRKDLHRTHSDIAMATEIDALAATKTKAVIAENAMVSRMTLLKMKRAKRRVLEVLPLAYKVKRKSASSRKNCSHNPFEAVNYTDDIVRGGPRVSG